MKKNRAFFFAVFAGVLLTIFSLASSAQQAKSPEPESSAPDSPAVLSPAACEQFFFAAANHERAATGLPILIWNDSLAAAARKHASRMAEENLLSHQLDGEPPLERRASLAGAHFTSVGENVAIGPLAQDIQVGWMNSPGHRANILGADYNSLGVGVVEDNGALFAVEDFSAAIAALTFPQQEEKVTAILTGEGLQVERTHDEARSYCADSSPPSGNRSMEVMRLETPDLSKLPKEIVRKIRSSGFRHAEVGACAPKMVDFARFRVAILLY
ncbi:MAG TPA: CAP domain-containing protein [Candidatus Acidoferrum sp.]|nr:CAP domain-containing protein [Candidatus Acidoferrum sp.]